MTSRIVGSVLLAVVASALLPGAVPAQQQGDAAAQGQDSDSTELVFQREVYSYPQYERRNPFAPLLGAGEGGPRFEQLRLLGILYSPTPGQSVALLTSGQGQNAPLSQSYRVRQGQTLGNSRIVEIQPSRVIVEVTEFGITEQRVLELQRPAEGGSS